MNDKHLGDRIHDLLDGRLSRTDTHAAMAHLDHCEECSKRWQELRSAREALNSSPAGIDMRFAQMLLDKDRMAQIAQGESKHVARAARGRGSARPASRTPWPPPPGCGWCAAPGAARAGFPACPA